MRSEIKRVKIIAMLLGVLLLVVLSLVVVTGMVVGPDHFGYWQIRYALITLVVAIGYESLAYLGFRYYQRRRTIVPATSRYGNALRETSIPTFVILSFTQLVHPVEALFSPPSYAYFFFIMLSTLRLEFRLSLFTGFVAAVEYGILVYWLSPEFSSYKLISADGVIGSGLVLPAFHVAKSMMYIIAGLIAGYVGREIRRNFQNTMASMEERNRVVDMFGAHVSPEVVERLLAQGETESETRHVCLMFLDIRNFTGFSENHTPAEVVAYLNELFDFMIDSVNNNKGIINKFLGDGFMAVFGAPISDGRDSRNAIQASLDILRKLEEKNSSGEIPLARIGIGLHAGDAVTGNVGSSRRKEYTIIGDTVNVASRLEQMNKKFDSDLLISDVVFRAARESGLEFEGQELEPIQVRGRQEMVPIYKLA